MIDKKSSFFQIYCWFLAFIASGIGIGSCHSNQDAALNDPIVAEGQRLAKQHCNACHLGVSPDLLDKETWEKKVLPAMAPKLGVESYEGGLYYAGSQAALSHDDWQKIIIYYRTMAPIKLKPARASVDALVSWAGFSPLLPRRDTTRTAVTTMVAMDTLSHTLYSGDGMRNDLFVWNQKLQPVLRKQFNSPVVSASFFRGPEGVEQGLFTCLGTMLPTDEAKGELVQLTLFDKQRMDSSMVCANLPRPLGARAADINKDGLTDWVVCGFGHLSGGLYWLEQKPNHQFVKRPIREVAGAIEATTGDFNADGWPDLMVLFAHADEGIWLFLNDKKGGFTERNVLRFPPVYGSTSFQLVDFNKDGRQDILYTCGDNSDYSQILKPYHGVYIFLNQGNGRYKQAYFQPMHGCVKAVAADFDQDGDMDIASIAFFADFKNKPEEGCLYLEQKQPMQFQPNVVPVSKYGRWICMDVTDQDQDGDLDIILGNFSKGFLSQTGFKPDWDTHLPFVVLKNTHRQ